MKKQNTKYKLIASSLTLGVLMLFTFSQVALGALDKDVEFTQTIDYDNSFLELDVVDGSGASVVSPVVEFATVTYDFIDQNSASTLGTAQQKIRVTNKRQTETWDLSIAASDPAALWLDSGSGDSYDYNDDTSGAQLTVDPSTGSIVSTNPSYFGTSNINMGSSAAFSSTVSDVTLVQAAANADTPGQWDIDGIGLSQVVPGNQNPGDYSIDFTLTLF